MKIIAFANRKGGVGKTTVSTHVSAALARQGQRVLHIDTDPQGHSALMFGMRKESGLFRLLVDNVEFDEVVRGIAPVRYGVEDANATGQLFLLPGDDRTSVIPMLDKNPFNFRNRLEEVQDLFDFCILDTAPTLNYFDGAVYLAVDAVLYMSQCEALSVDGLKDGMRQLAEFSKDRPGAAKVIGIQPNQLMRTANHAANLEMVKEVYGDLVWDPIPQRTVIGEAATMRQLIYTYNPDSEVVGSFNVIASRLMMEAIYA